MAESPPVVLITGASRGLGRGIALRVSELGCSIAVHYSTNERGAKETVELCTKKRVTKGQKFVVVQGDIAHAADRRSLVKQTLDGLGRIDALVNNAGVGPSQRTDLVDMTEESFDRVLATNLRGPHFLTQLVADYWLKAGWKPLLPPGFIVVFISSVSAEMVSLNRGEYCISKAGLSMAARLWAARLAGDGIQVYEIRPGVMATDMTRGVKDRYDKRISDGEVPQRRWGEPDDVGLAVKALLQGSFPFSPGAVIHVDGGLTIPRL